MAVTRLPAPTGGYDANSAATLLPKDKAVTLQNFLVDQPGKLRVRGPLGAAEEIFGSSTTPTGIWVHGEKFLVSKSATSKLYDTDAGTVTNVSLTDATRQLDGRSARIGPLAIGPSTDASTGLLRWDGTTAQPAIMPESPEGAADVCTHLERLFVAGGTEPGTLLTNVYPATLWYSDAGGPLDAGISVSGVAATDLLTGLTGFANGDQVRFSALTGGTGLAVGLTYYVVNVSGFDFKLATTAGGAAINFTTDISAATISKAATNWQDDVSGLNNEIVVGNEGDPIVALASVGRQLLVLKQHSIWAIFGDSPSSFTVRQLYGTLGCADKMSVELVDDTCFFLDSHGRPRIYDGTQLTQLEGLDSRFLTITAAHAVRLPNDYLAVRVTSGAATEAALLYLPSKSWTSFSVESTDVLASTSTWLLAATESGDAYVFDDKYARSLGDVPFGVNSSNLGLDAQADGSGNGYYPPARVTYRTENLGLPLTNAVVRSVVADHKLWSDEADLTWQVDLDTFTGTTNATVALVSDSSDAVQRAANDVNTEFSDLAVTLHLERDPDNVSAPDGIAAAEVYDLWVEYAPAQRR